MSDTKLAVRPDQLRCSLSLSLHMLKAGFLMTSHIFGRKTLKYNLCYGCLLTGNSISTYNIGLCVENNKIIIK